MGEGGEDGCVVWEGVDGLVYHSVPIGFFEGSVVEDMFSSFFDGLFQAFEGWFPVEEDVEWET